MASGFSCKACDKGFDAEWSPGGSVTCPHCGTCFETDYDTDADDNIQGPWLKFPEAARLPYPLDGDCFVGMDVPQFGSWGPEDVAFWTGTERYQPWKDVATFFKETDDAR